MHTVYLFNTLYHNWFQAFKVIHALSDSWLYCQCFKGMCGLHLQGWNLYSEKVFRLFSVYYTWYQFLLNLSLKFNDLSLWVEHTVQGVPLDLACSAEYITFSHLLSLRTISLTLLSTALQTFWHKIFQPKFWVNFLIWYILQDQPT